MLILINLASATERRQHMEEQFKALGVSFQTVGVDLRGCSREQARAVAVRHRPGIEFDFASLSTAEVGCWVSHLAAWQLMLNSDHGDFCTVVEDDVRLAPDFVAVVSALQVRTPYDVVYLGTSSRNLSTRRKTRIGSLLLHEPVGAIFNTWGYTIARRYAERILGLERLRVDQPIDHFLGGKRGHCRPRIAVLQPPVVEEDPALGVASQIEPYTRRIDRWRIVERARRRLLSSHVCTLYYSLYRFL